MSTEDTNDRRNWAVVTHEGELESEDEASCSESSIELLSSEEEEDSSSLDRSSALGSQSGLFFVLRLRSKEILTESDSDEKELLTKIKAQRTNELQGDLEGTSISENEHEAKQREDKTGRRAAENIETLGMIEDQPEINDDSKSGTTSVTSPEMESQTSDLEIESTETVSQTAIPLSEEQSSIKDDISFPTSSNESSDESIPEILHLISSGESSIMNEDKEHSVKQEDFPSSDLKVKQEEVVTDIQDDNSLTSSNFSLVGDECNEMGTVERGDNYENTITADEQDAMKESITSGPEDTECSQNQEHVDGNDMRRRMNSGTGNSDEIHENETGNPLNVTVRPNIIRDEPKLFLVLEVVTIFVVAGLSYYVGFYQGSYGNQDLIKARGNLQGVNNNLHDRIEEDTKNLDSSLRSLISDFDQGLDKDLDQGLFKDLKQADEECPMRKLQKRELNGNIEQYVCLIRNRFQSKASENIIQKEASAKLKEKIDDLRNENADLQREIEEHGKRKYLIKELEDENIALFKRISDMESQLMEAEDKSYILQLKLSKAERKKEFSPNNDESISELKNTVEGLKEERKTLKHRITTLESDQKILVEANEKKYVNQLNKKDQESTAAILNAELEVEKLKKGFKKCSIQVDELEARITEQEKRCFEEKKIKDNRYEEDVDDDGINIDLEDDITENKHHGKDFPSEHSGQNDESSRKKRSGDKSKEKKNKKGGGRNEREDKDKKNRTEISWSDAFNDILNKTKISMVNVNQQIQDTLSKMKNVSEELWKKHEPKVNDVLKSTYEKVKNNVHDVAKKVSHAAKTIVKKSAKWKRKYKNSRKHTRHHGNQDGEWEHSSNRATTSRRGHHKNHAEGNHQQKTDDNNNDHKYHHHNHHHGDTNHHQGRDNFGGFLINELENLRDSVEYTNMLKELGCSSIIDIMEDFQHFKKVEGTAILSMKEKSWFYCQKSWYESMFYSDPYIDIECREEMGIRQLAASDNGCCPCFNQYGRSTGKFCKLNEGCSKLQPKDKKWTYKKKEVKTQQESKLKEKHQVKNETQEEEVAMNHGKHMYCDPFSKDLDCGDESWYLKRMRDREHLRKYRSSSKTDWLFHRAEDRDFYRTQPDTWYFNKMSGGQAYEAHADDLYHEKEDFYHDDL